MRFVRKVYAKYDVSANDTKLGTRLKKVLASAEAYAILDSVCAGTWQSGGCYLLSKALQTVLGGELVGIEGKLPTQKKAITQHVALKVGDRYFDGDGESSAAEILNRWRTVEKIQDAKLIPVAEQKLSADFCSDKKAEIALAKLLRASGAVL